MAFTNAQKQSRYRAKRLLIRKIDLCSLCRTKALARRRRRK